MPMNTPVANGDPTLAALIPEGVTLAHIITLFHDACPINGVQLLRARLGATHPANLSPPELAEFIKSVLAVAKSAGIRDPAALLADTVRREAEAAAAKLGSSAAIGDFAAERKSDGHAPVTIENNSSTISDASTPRPVAQIIAYGTAEAGDERQLLGERRVAEMLGCSPRTLQRWRMEGKGPPSTKIGRKVFYELNDLQEWIDRGKIR